MAVSRYPLPPFSRRRKECPTPVLASERRRGRSRGGYPPLPGEAALGQLSGRAVVETVVRFLTDGDEVPAAEAPAGETIYRVDVMGNGCRLTPAVSQRLLAQRLLAKHAGAKCFPSLARVIHGKIKNAGPPSVGDSALLPPGYRLGCKTKSADRLPHGENSIGADSGSGLAALALVLAHIHDRFASAMFAVQGEICQGRRRQDLDSGRVPAFRTNDLVSL